jgi:hypothetical protein
MPHTYAQAEGVLARLHAASGDVQRRAFRGRLKHLKRLGIPRGINPGRGKKVLYEDKHVWEWAFCLELAEFGLDPTLVVRLIEQKWADDILPRFEAAQKTLGDGNDLYLAAHPRLMGDAWAGAPSALPFQWVRRERAEGGEVLLGRWINRLSGDQRRAILINLYALLGQMGFERVLVDSANAAARHERED